MKMEIRAERPSDEAAVYQVNAAAFKTAAEADLVDRLRREASPIISLVAEVDGAIAGHIMFSPVTLTGHPHLHLMGLGPMAVAPGAQRSGIGSALVRAGLEECRQLGAGAVIVLGHPWFYPRFGFVPTTRYSIRWVHPVPAEVFMALELRPGYLDGASGEIHYHPAFDGV